MLGQVVADHHEAGVVAGVLVLEPAAVRWTRFGCLLPATRVGVRGGTLGFWIPTGRSCLPRWSGPRPGIAVPAGAVSCLRLWWGVVRCPALSVGPGRRGNPAGSRGSPARVSEIAGGRVGLGGVLFPEFFGLLAADVTEARRSAFRCRSEVDLRPDRLTGVAALGDSPAVGERVHEEEPAARLRDAVGLAQHGRRSPRVSVTSTRSVAPTTYSVSRKLRPGTRPCVAALAASSATTCPAVSYGTPQLRSASTASRRARRAPRAVDDNSTLMCRTWASGRVVLVRAIS